MQRWPSACSPIDLSRRSCCNAVDRQAPLKDHKSMSHACVPSCRSLAATPATVEAPAAELAIGGCGHFLFRRPS